MTPRTQAEIDALIDLVDAAEFASSARSTAEIARRLGCDEDEVILIERRALAKLRRIATDRGWAP